MNGTITKTRIGQKVGFLTILSDPKTIDSHRYCTVQCICGKIFERRVTSIFRKDSRNISCGCSRTENGIRISHSRIYQTFADMKKRCNNSKCADYPSYGGRGIKVEWNSFKEFYKDMNKSYIEHCEKYGESNTTIDRIDVNGNYSNNNCRWADWVTQNNNKTCIKVRDMV